MSSRKVTSAEIQAVGSILQDKEAIELLKKINEQVVTEEDTKGKRKQNDIFAFVGFAHQDDILGEDKESKEYQQKQGSVKTLVDAGLILEGFHIPLERKNEKKFGDVRVSSEERISKYKLTEEGLTLLAAIDQTKVAAPQSQQQSTPQPKPPQTKQTAAPPAKPTNSINKDKAIANFKEEILDENKL